MGNGTELGRVRGLGSSKHGAQHWWHQRLTAAGNLVLMAWLLASIALLPGHDYESVRRWIASPVAAVPMALLVLSTFYHFRLGLQVLIEDYLHDHARVAALLMLNFFVVGAGATAIFSILKIAFTGAAA